MSALSIQTQTLALGPQTTRRFDSILFSETRRFAFAQGQGSLRTDLVRLGGDGLRIGRVVSTGHEIELAETGDATLLAPRRGRLEIDHGRRTWDADPGRTLVFSPSTRRTRVSGAGAGGFEGHVVMLPAPRLAALRAAAAGGEGGRPEDAARIDGPASARLGAYAAFLFDHVFGCDAAERGAAALARMLALLEDLVADVAAGAGVRPSDAARRVRMAEEIMRARSSEPLAMHEVARAVGVGLRSLQLAFRAERGEEPRATLARVRMEGARARLLAAPEGDSVTAIALDCGFAHLGRFAVAYRRAYGERPSETLARRC